MSDPPVPTYEIDMGDSPPEQPAAPSPPDGAQPSAEEREEEVRLDGARTAALAHWEGAALARQRVDIEGLILAGLCGEGVGAVLRVDDWHAGVSLAMLATLASLGLAVWLWWRTRLPATHLITLPSPSDPRVVVRNVPQDAGARAASRQRREAEYGRIQVSVADLSTCQRRLRAAVLAALGGAFCGWLAGLAGNPGAPVLAASAAAGTAALTAWLAAEGQWSELRLHRLLFGLVPAVALLAGLLSGASPWSAIGGPLAAAAAGWFWRRRLTALIVPGQPQEAQDSAAG